MSGTVPAWSLADLASTLQQHLPTGRAWPRDPLSVQSQTIAALAANFQRLTGRAANLLIDGFPATTVELLPEWQASLGLPDPCAGAAVTLAQEQQQVLARFESNGGQSIAFFTAFALALGYTITVDQFAPFRAGISRAGTPDYSQAWAFAWQINGPPATLTYFTVDSSAVGDNLSFYTGSTVLECEMQRLSPAHTLLIIEL
jgi:uncharacterized protein YmfQ (DUF2313 family)